MSKSAAQNLVPNSCVLGLGSGSSVARFAKALGQRAKKESLRVAVVPSSMQSWLLAMENDLTLVNDSGHCPPSIDIAVDGADEISIATRSMIKGGGGALLKEKIIFAAAKKCYVLADESKYVQKLERSVPVEVTQFSALSVEHKIRGQLGAEPNMRKLEKGYPFFTESGNVILDCQFGRSISDPAGLEVRLKSIAGVVEVGIFNNPVEMFYKANHDGTFETL